MFLTPFSPTDLSSEIKGYEYNINSSQIFLIKFPTANTIHLSQGQGYFLTE